MNTRPLDENGFGGKSGRSAPDEILPSFHVEFDDVQLGLAATTEAKTVAETVLPPVELPEIDHRQLETVFFRQKNFRPTEDGTVRPFLGGSGIEGKPHQVGPDFC